MSNKKCVHCYEYQDMGARFDVCDLYAPTIVPAECDGCKRYKRNRKKDLVDYCSHSERR